MLGLEMQDAKAKRLPPTLLEIERFERSGAPSEVEREFARQLATSVWMLQLGHDEAREALAAYVFARFHERPAQASLFNLLEREYCSCRERLDLCS